MTRPASLSQAEMARAIKAADHAGKAAVEKAEGAMAAGISGPGWALILASITTIRGCEVFRLALLLRGRDTRSARIAIQERKDIIAGLRDAAPRKTLRGRPKGSRNRRPRTTKQKEGIHA